MRWLQQTARPAAQLLRQPVEPPKPAPQKPKPEYVFALKLLEMLSRKGVLSHSEAAELLSYLIDS